MPKIKIRMKIWRKCSKQVSLLHILKYEMKEKIVIKISVKNDKIKNFIPNITNLTKQYLL